MHVSFALCEMLSRIKTAPPDAGRVRDWLWGMVDEGEEAWSTAGWRYGGSGVEIQGIRILGIGPLDPNPIIDHLSSPQDCEREEVEGQEEEPEEVEEGPEGLKEEEPEGIEGEEVEEGESEGIKEEEMKDHGMDPHYPETIQEAYGRFEAEFRRLMGRVHEGLVVLAVTHGDAVGRSVSLCQPNAVVYEVGNAGYCCLSDEFALIEEHGVGYFVYA